MTKETAMIEQLLQAKSITFLTGAGVSTPSGIPDYRSLHGIYQGLDQPEYLLSATCLKREPEKFYSFIKQLYHPDALPNVIHQTIHELEKTHNVWVVSQNIDGLHDRAGSTQVVNFHGSLYHVYCQSCGKEVPYADYLASDHHLCGCRLRPAIVLYEEGFTPQTIKEAVRAVEAADIVVIVGTTFQVHPFCDLIEYKQKNAQVFVVNQTPIHLRGQKEQLIGNAVDFFQALYQKLKEAQP